MHVFEMFPKKMGDLPARQIVFANLQPPQLLDCVRECYPSRVHRPICCRGTGRKSFALARPVAVRSVE